MTRVQGDVLEEVEDDRRHQKLVDFTPSTTAHDCLLGHEEEQRRLNEMFVNCNASQSCWHTVSVSTVAKMFMELCHAQEYAAWNVICNFIEEQSHEQQARVGETTGTSLTDRMGERGEDMGTDHRNLQDSPTSPC